MAAAQHAIEVISISKNTTMNCGRFLVLMNIVGLGVATKHMASS
jgi:hypothetical protein